jgi:hypothetical protein
MKKKLPLMFTLFFISVLIKAQVIYHYVGDVNGTVQYVDPNATGTNLLNPGLPGYRCDSGYFVRTFNNDPFFNAQIGFDGDYNYDANGRIDFTIYPNPGYQLNLSSITVTGTRLQFGPSFLKLGMNINNLGIIEGTESGNLPMACEFSPPDSNPPPIVHTWNFDDINSLTPVSFTIGTYGGLNNIAIVYKAL